MSIKKILMLAGLCALFTGCSTGGLYSQNGQYANEGTGPSRMGVRYLLGRGVEQNNEKAFNYFSQAANSGDVMAQNEIAYMYAAGKGTPRNYTKSLYWYNKAANHGLASAQYNLGLMYYYGMGTPVNKPVANDWFKKSAAHGFEPAAQMLKRA